MVVLYQYHKNEETNFFFRLVDCYSSAAHHKRAWHDLHFGLNIDIGE